MFDQLDADLEEKKEPRKERKKLDIKLDSPYVLFGGSLIGIILILYIALGGSSGEDKNTTITETKKVVLEEKPKNENKQPDEQNIIDTDAVNKARLNTQKLNEEEAKQEELLRQQKEEVERAKEEEKKAALLKLEAEKVIAEEKAQVKAQEEFNSKRDKLTKEIKYRGNSSFRYKNKNYYTYDNFEEFKILDISSERILLEDENTQEQITIRIKK